MSANPTPISILLDAASSMTARKKHHHSRREDSITDNFASGGVHSPYRNTVPRSLLTRIEAMESLSQDLVSRARRDPPDQAYVRFPSGTLDPRKRLPLLGLRSQDAAPVGRTYPRGELYPGRDALFNPLREVPGTKTICQRRSDRRRALFKLHVAGSRKRRSPGSGGSYRRTPDSYYHCRTSR